MVSKTAQADIEDMWEQGLKPTFHDIIRLNALALRVERKQAQFALSEMPRAAKLGDVVFREPTIGSEIWFSSASRFFTVEQMETFILLRAFSLSMPQDQLPDPVDTKAITQGIQDFKVSLAFATAPQLISAVGYVIHGFSPDECEHPTPRKDGNGKEQDDACNTSNYCYEIGVLRHGVMYGVGSASELKNLSADMLNEMILRKIALEHNPSAIKNVVSDLEDDYLRTLDEITARLKSEKDND